VLNYKGYFGGVRIDTEAGLIRGRVLNTKDVITFQGKTVEEAEREFRNSVDDYLEFCAARGEEPERPFSGNFPVRTTPDVHRSLMLAAARRGVSLNAFLGGYLRRLAAKVDAAHHGGGVAVEKATRRGPAAERAAKPGRAKRGR
jgi:predicted HicB family RNase H-like nuclease